MMTTAAAIPAIRMDCDKEDVSEAPAGLQVQQSDNPERKKSSNHGTTAASKQVGKWILRN